MPTKSAPSVASKPQVATQRLIKQDELQAVLNARLVAETLAKQAKEAKEDVERLELLLISRVKQGSRQESGELAASVGTRDGARRPKWKEEFAALAGPDAVERVIQATAPSGPTEVLVISARGKVAKTA